MPISPNLTEQTVVESDLTARFPALNQLGLTDQETWQPQILLGKEMALRRFREARPNLALGPWGQVTTEPVDPLRAAARDDEDWVNIIALFTLGIILGGNVQADLVGRGKEFMDEAENALRTFLWDYDADDDGNIDRNTQEEARSLTSIQLVRA